jgi:hypothetical protein
MYVLTEYHARCNDVTLSTHTLALPLTQDDSDRDSTNSNYMQPPPAEYGAQKSR